MISNEIDWKARAESYAELLREARAVIWDNHNIYGVDLYDPTIITRIDAALVEKAASPVAGMETTVEVMARMANLEAEREEGRHQMHSHDFETTAEEREEWRNGPNASNRRLLRDFARLEAERDSLRAALIAAGITPPPGGGA